MWRWPDRPRRGDPFTKLAWVVRWRGRLLLEDSRWRRQASSDGRATVRHDWISISPSLLQSILTEPSSRILDPSYMRLVWLEINILWWKKKMYFKNKKQKCRSDAALQACSTASDPVIIKNICSRVLNQYSKGSGALSTCSSWHFQAYSKLLHSNLTTYRKHGSVFIHIHTQLCSMIKGWVNGIRLLYFLLC